MTKGFREWTEEHSKFDDEHINRFEDLKRATSDGSFRDGFRASGTKREPRLVNPEFKPTEKPKAAELTIYQDPMIDALVVRMPNGMVLAAANGQPYDLRADWLRDRNEIPTSPDEIANKYIKVYENFRRFWP